MVTKTQLVAFVAFRWHQSCQWIVNFPATWLQRNWFGAPVTILCPLKPRGRASAHDVITASVMATSVDNLPVGPVHCSEGCLSGRYIFRPCRTLYKYFTWNFVRQSTSNGHRLNGSPWFICAGAAHNLKMAPWRRVRIWCRSISWFTKARHWPLS